MAKKFNLQNLKLLWIVLLTLGSNLINNISYSSTEFPLPANQAFHISFNSEYRLTPENHFLQIHCHIAPGYELYADALKLVHQSNNSEINLSNYLPQPSDLSKKRLSYEKSLIINIPILEFQSPEHLRSDWSFHYQGCQKNGVCYAPAYKNVSVKIPTTQRALDIIEHQTFSKTILSWLGFFGMGLLLAFTPCMLPMLPIVLNLIIRNQNTKTANRAQTIYLVSSYILGTAVMYAIAGLISASLGSTVQAYLQQPIFIFSLSSLLILMAAYQLDFLTLPGVTTINNPLYTLQNKIHIKHNYWTAGLLGGLSALLLSPCVTPALIGVLTYIAKTGNYFLGGTTLFALGLGMGFPLLILAIIGPNFLPRSGPWLNWTKRIAAFFLIGLSVWLSWPFLSDYYTSKNNSILNHGSEPQRLENKERLEASEYLESLESLELKHANSLKKQNWSIKTIASISELDNNIKLAKNQNKPVILDFSAEWCKTCKTIEKNVFQDPDVLKKLQSFIVLKIDLTHHTQIDPDLTKKFQVFAPPTIIFLDPNVSNQIHQQTPRCVGNMTKTDFLKKLTELSQSQQQLASQS